MMVYGNGSGEGSGLYRIYKNINNTWTQIGSDLDGEAAGIIQVNPKLFLRMALYEIGALGK